MNVAILASFNSFDPRSGKLDPRLAWHDETEGTSQPQKMSTCTLRPPFLPSQSRLNTLPTTYLQILDGLPQIYG
jgi:hypothetical protein